MHCQLGIKRTYITSRSLFDETFCMNTSSWNKTTPFTEIAQSSPPTTCANSPIYPFRRGPAQQRLTLSSLCFVLAHFAESLLVPWRALTDTDV
jgi:hypothetical protein